MTYTDKVVSPQMKYYYKNRDKIRKEKSKYYRKNKIRFNEISKVYRLNNKDRIRELNKKYVLSHREEINKKHTPYMREYRRKNKEHIKELNKSYYWKNRDRILQHDRKHELKGSINGESKFISGLNKRDYPGFCELCEKEQPYKLNYHHWDDSNPSKGVWVCVRCHGVCEGVEKKLVDRYLILRTLLNREMKNGLQ